MKFYLAPLEGVTGFIFRNTLEKYFPGTDRYFTPFIVPNQKRVLRTKEERDVLPGNNHVKSLIPQILTNDAEQFKDAVRALREYGYEEVNLNLGCPSGTVVSHGKGAGFLAFPEKLDRFLDRIFQENDVKISVKTRIGIEDPAEAYGLMEIYNKYPLSELIIHPRTRQEYYRGTPHLDIFGELLERSRVPVCYNGNLLTVEDYERLRRRFPKVEAVMLGRGVIANPGLIQELAHLEAEGVQGADQQEYGRSKTATEKAEKKENMHRFHDEIFEQYREVFRDDKNAMLHMKEVWAYMIHSFVDAEKYIKRIRKSKSAPEYRMEVDRLFQECELCTGSPLRWALPQKQ
ncbi:MAG: tRNA-dihydrouridine synthase family protein [Eubacteriales bacterium]|nr:tRNA-dihydrouridine synthase family protein [Eubacteriales bacterium]